MAEADDDLTRLLEGGWEVKGYSTYVAAAGAIFQSVLVQKGAGLRSFTIITNGASEVGRAENVLAPKPEVKKSSFW